MFDGKLLFRHFSLSVDPFAQLSLPLLSTFHPPTQLNLGNTSKSCSRPPTTSDASHRCRSPRTGLLFRHRARGEPFKTAKIAFARPAGHGISMPHRGFSPRRGSRHSNFRASLPVPGGSSLSRLWKSKDFPTTVTEEEEFPHHAPCFPLCPWSAV